MFFLVMTVISRFIVPALPTPILSGDGIWVSRQSPQWLPDPLASGRGGETRESPVGLADLPARGRDQEGDCGVGSGRTGGKQRT